MSSVPPSNINRSDIPARPSECWLFNLQAAGGLTVLAYCLFKLRQRNRAGNPHASETR